MHPNPNNAYNNKSVKILTQLIIEVAGDLVKEKKHTCCTVCVLSDALKMASGLKSFIICVRNFLIKKIKIKTLLPRETFKKKCYQQLWT